MPDPTANQEAQARTAETDHPAHLAHPDPQVNPDKTDQRDHPAPPPSAFQPHPESPAHLARTAHLVPQARTAPLAQTEAPAQQETKARPAHRVLPATMVLQETRDHPAPMDPRESGVFARNIVPPMAVSSSRMAQGDKRSFETLRSVCYSDEKPVILSIAFLLVFVFDGHANTAATFPVISFGAF